jgi:hypothetical protein
VVKCHPWDRGVQYEFSTRLSFPQHVANTRTRRVVAGTRTLPVQCRTSVVPRNSQFSEARWLDARTWRLGETRLTRLAGRRLRRSGSLAPPSLSRGLPRSRIPKCRCTSYVLPCLRHGAMRMLCGLSVLPLAAASCVDTEGWANPFGATCQQCETGSAA